MRTRLSTTSVSSLQDSISTLSHISQARYCPLQPASLLQIGRLVLVGHVHVRIVAHAGTFKVAVLRKGAWCVSAAVIR